jgi:hypothetical protein
MVPAPALAFCLTSLPEIPRDYYSVAKEFGRSAYVATVRVTKEVWIGEDGKPTALHPPFLNRGPQPLGFDPYKGAFYDVDLLKAYKGSPNARLSLFSDNSTARFPMKVGSDYLVFMSLEQTDGLGPQLGLDNCGNSAPLVYSAKALRSVKRLVGHAPKPSP